MNFVHLTLPFVSRMCATCNIIAFESASKDLTKSKSNNSKSKTKTTTKTNIMMTIQSTATFLFLFVGSAAAASCNMCTVTNNQFDSVPARNADRLVQTSQGRFNCEGLHFAGLNGIFATVGECRTAAREMAPTCCNLPSQSEEADDESKAIELPEEQEEEETFEEIGEEEEQEFRDLSSNNGHSCNLCTAGNLNNQYSSVPAVNRNKIVRTSKGPLPCGPWFQAALNGDMFTSQNVCNAFALEFQTCCNSNTRALRGGN